MNVNHMDIRKVWEHAGYPCLLCSNQLMGHLCGYILLPKSHPLYLQSYDDIQSVHNIDVHGGLTFAQKVNISDFDNKRLIRIAGGAKDMYMIGFDCAHYGDMPYLNVVGSDIYEQIYQDDDDCHTWTPEEVIEEIEKLADQLMLVDEQAAPISALL